MTPFQWIFGTLCALMALRLVWRVSRGNGSRLAGWFWALLWTGAAVTIFRPSITSELAALFGIGRGADFVIYLEILAFLLVTRFFYSRYRQLQNTLTALTREIAMERAARNQS
ncbi:MAG: DUF2304 domain-containing protein [Bryobacteraceae bacterium]